MRALVTGGAGFIGGHLVQALSARGDDVVVLDNLRRGDLRDPADARNVEMSTGDIRDYATVLAASRGAEVVYHLAAQSNVMGAVDDPDYSFTTNVAGTYNVLKAATAAGVRRVVFTSSREVYGEPERLPVSESALLDPKNAYGASKVAGEAYCRAWSSVNDLEVQVLRFANIYGPRDRQRVIPLWLDLASRGEEIIVFGGEQVLDFLSVGHAVEALLAAVDCKPTGPVNVGSGKGTSILALAERIRQLSGSRSSVRIVPARGPEVVRFIADVRRMDSELHLAPPADPLEALSDLWAAFALSG